MVIRQSLCLEKIAQIAFFVCHQLPIQKRKEPHKTSFDVHCVFSTTKCNALDSNLSRKPRVECGNLTSFLDGIETPLNLFDLLRRQVRKRTVLGQVLTDQRIGVLDVWLFRRAVGARKVNRLP